MAEADSACQRRSHSSVRYFRSQGVRHCKQASRREDMREMSRVLSFAADFIDMRNRKIFGSYLTLQCYRGMVTW